MNAAVNAVRAAVGAAALAAGLATVPATALAHAARLRPGHLNIAGAVSTSNIDGGYLAAPADGVASVSTEFTVPTATTCPTNAFNEFGVVLYDTAGTAQAFAGLDVACSGTTPTYNLVAGTLTKGGYTTTGVSPGDKLLVAAYDTPSNTVAEVTNLTTGVTWSQSDGTGDASGKPSAAALIGVTDFNGPLQNFGHIHFQQDEVNGEQLYQVAPGKVNLKSGSDIQTNTSGVTLGGFTLSFKRSS